MRIFFVCRRVPFPPDRGDRIATYHQIRHLAQRHEVHVFSLADSREDMASATRLRDCTAGVTAVSLSPLRGALRALRAVLGAGPLSAAMLRETELCRLIRRRFSELRPDLIMVYGSNMAQYAESLLDVRRIMQFADLNSRKWRDYAARSALPMRLIYALEARRLLDYERHVALTFSHAVVCTPEEADDFAALIPGTPVSVVPNGVDLAYFAPGGVAKDPCSLVFTGVMEYRPNVDAVSWFCADILPLVRQQVPNATLTICGNRPATAVQRLAGIAGVTVTGRVPDVRPYLHRAEVFVAPLRLARGIQNKVLEAMAMGLPVVSSRIAWRPTALQEGDGIVAADRADDFAAHIVRLLQDPRYREAMGRRARAAMERNYAWAERLAALDRVIEGEQPRMAIPRRS